MKEAPRFDDGEPLKKEAETHYCDKGGHFKRSVFNKSLTKAQKLGLEKCDLTLDDSITVYEETTRKEPEHTHLQ